jgi:hypothetical protein
MMTYNRDRAIFWALRYVGSFNRTRQKCGAEASVVVRSIVVGALIVVRRFHQVDDVSFVKPQ